MSEPFRVVKTYGFYLWTVRVGDNEVACFHKKKSAQDRRDEMNYAWSAAGGPALTRQRDELLALLREFEPALNAHAQSYAHACCTTELHPFDAALLDRVAAAIKEKP